MTRKAYKYKICLETKKLPVFNGSLPNNITAAQETSSLYNNNNYEHKNNEEDAETQRRPAAYSLPTKETLM